MSEAVGAGRCTPGSQPGTYILLMRLARGESLTIGRLGRERFLRGWYLYVGSAFGPGGVAARCRHHRQVSTRPRWHVDYLRAVAPLRAIWFSYAEASLEHRWAARLGGELALRMPMPGFGASDCDCPSHLFFAPTRPDLRHFSTRLASDLGSEESVYCEIV